MPFNLLLDCISNTYMFVYLYIYTLWLPHGNSHLRNRDPLLPGCFGNSRIMLPCLVSLSCSQFQQFACNEPLSMICTSCLADSYVALYMRAIICTIAFISNNCNCRINKNGEFPFVLAVRDTMISYLEFVFAAQRLNDGHKDPTRDFIRNADAQIMRRQGNSLSLLCMSWTWSAFYWNCLCAGLGVLYPSSAPSFLPHISCHNRVNIW